MNTEGFRVWAHNLRDTLRPLSPAAKAEYIWEYYKLWIIGIASAIILVIWMIVRFTTNVPDCYLYVVFANTREDAGNGSPLWNSFVSAEGYDLKQGRVEFDSSAYFDYTVNQARGNRYYEAFVALADAGVLDAVTMETESLSALGQSGRLLNLNAPLCDAVRERYSSRLVWYQPQEGDPIPVGIDVSDSILMTEYHLYTGSCSLGIAVETQNIDQISAFLSFILEEEGTHAGTN